MAYNTNIFSSFRHSELCVKIARTEQRFSVARVQIVRECGNHSNWQPYGLALLENRLCHIDIKWMPYNCRNYQWGGKKLNVHSNGWNGWGQMLLNWPYQLKWLCFYTVLEVFCTSSFRLIDYTATVSNSFGTHSIFYSSFDGWFLFLPEESITQWNSITWPYTLFACKYMPAYPLHISSFIHWLL